MPGANKVKIDYDVCKRTLIALLKSPDGKDCDKERITTLLINDEISLQEGCRLSNLLHTEKGRGSFSMTVEELLRLPSEQRKILDKEDEERDKLQAEQNIAKAKAAAGASAARQKERRKAHGPHDINNPAPSKGPMTFGEMAGIIFGVVLVILLVLYAVGVSRIPKNSPFWEENDREVDQFDNVHQ